MLPVPSSVDHPCARGESIGGCAEHGPVPMMVRMDFGSRSREYNGSDGNDVNIYGHEYVWIDERRIQIWQLLEWVKVVMNGKLWKGSSVAPKVEMNKLS
jgi:hypothetical protein